MKGAPDTDGLPLGKLVMDGPPVELEGIAVNPGCLDPEIGVEVTVGSPIG